MACGDEIPVTIEYRRVWFGPGTLIDPTKYCVDADTDCCGSGSGEPVIDYPACCGETFETALDGTFVGPFPDTCISTELITGDGLIWNTEHLAWEGSTVNVGGAQLDVSLWCDDEGVFYGTALIYRDGVYFDSFDFTLEVGPDGTTLVAELDVPTLDCEDNTVSIEITHPCPAGACATACPEIDTARTFTATITNKVGVCSCLPDSFTLTYQILNSRWEGPTYTCLPVECEENALPILQCDGNEWEYIPSGVGTRTGSCVDGVLTISWDITAPFGGSYTITFTLDPA